MRTHTDSFKESEAELGHDSNWWTETMNMINRGYHRFCMRHNLPTDRSPLEFSTRRNKRNKTKPATPEQTQ